MGRTELLSSSDIVDQMLGSNLGRIESFIRVGRMPTVESVNLCFFDQKRGTWVTRSSNVLTIPTGERVLGETVLAHDFYAKEGIIPQQQFAISHADRMAIAQRMNTYNPQNHPRLY